MAWLLSIPLSWRCLAIFLIGLPIGSLLNLGIYTLAWNWRALSPWSRAPQEVPPRRWYDRLPVIGWLSLRRETSQWGRGFWVRPLLIELATASSLAALYYWHVTGELLPQPLPVILSLPGTQWMLHVRFLSQAVLLAMMIVATFIDFDEKTIPDWITVPGTLVGLTFATLWPMSLPPDLAGTTLDPLWLTAPHAWSPLLDAWLGLVLGLVCYVGWCFGILEKLWTVRRGWYNATRYFFASVARGHNRWLVLGLAVIGTLIIFAVWWQGGAAWQGLLTSLVGMAFGGGLVWAIRIIGTHALEQEAMGFGDVTLMAMIGAFVGWQGALIAFFMAPFAALGIALLQWLFTGRKDLAFGPYLCAGALIVMLRWAELWELPRGVKPNFALGWVIPVIIAVCLALMWLMLLGMRALRRRFLE